MIDYTPHFAAINSLTKYPSILTYHKIGERGKLTAETTTTFDPDERVIVAEKVDGANARLIILPGGDFLVGSREELLWAKGDRVPNPASGIVETLRQLPLDDIASNLFIYVPPPSDTAVVIYGEVYGHKTMPNRRNYTATDATGFRVFDVATFDIRYIHTIDARQAADLRDAGGVARWLTYPFLGLPADLLNVPYRSGQLPPPADIAACRTWLRTYAVNTGVALDGPVGLAEGVVVRSLDRKRIVKIRNEDYNWTLDGKRR